ncbi:chemotaxis protein CheR [Pedobacter polaris]|uniref:Chemotaxis protein CheR n=1 Tax=Pedobacter polaris TaxID=2571273 RepID=A0A4U1CLH5_9SPHI|nr:CheR family methyltransferase [Pedobacter polaris]TKC08066.1 chemotaxis protein CheR [Pedobacter polaris]
MKKPEYIVAIGASAGGLEALSAFFEHTPIDSVSYIIIPHLSPDFKSRMVEILSRHSELDILEAEEEMPVEINKVYLIPNTKYMGIRNGKLFLIEKEGQSLPHMTIDAFLTSLADERGPKAIGIVLSGVGSDGSLGAIAVENAGGVVMVQDPNETKFDGMPRSVLNAIDTPYVFSAADLPLAIQRYISTRNEIDVTAEAPLSEEALAKFVDLIKDQYPFDFTHYKNGTLERRIRRRMTHHNLLELDSFFAYLQKNPQEIELLISDFLIGVTSFFRDREAYEVLEREVLPKIISAKSENELLKVWVTCCATGEEAYSLAILIKEYLLEQKSNIDVKIFATDINENALKQAAKGVFSNNITKTVSKERLVKFFDKATDSFKIKPEIREMLIFARHDLTKNPPYCYVDLISCRNMLIYIKPVLQKQILAKLGFGLRKNGYLFLGSSENISVAKDTFVEISAKWKIYQSIKSDRAIIFDGQLTAPISNLSIKYGEKEIKPKALPRNSENAPDLNEAILSESGLSGVIIDREGKVSNSFGDLSAYLKQERFKFDLRELLPENLSLAFSSTLQKVIKSNQRERINNISFIEPETAKHSTADLIVSPYADRKTNFKGMLVLFKKSETVEVQHNVASFKIDVQTKEYIAQLEEDLMQASQDLNSSNDFLETSKEAMQAFNEELLSANEEMQSANEELHSINEELETVNAAHKYTINELTDLNDDLNNYFRSNVNGQLFVDKDILLKKYSPGAVSHINIMESDLGRPLSNITTNIKFETLIDDIKKVISDGEIIIKEIESNQGRLYQVMTSPYLKKGNDLPNGAIITFYDVTDLKKAQHELDKSIKMLSLATVASEMGTWSIDVQDKELFCSIRLKEIFGFEADTEVALDDIIGQIEISHQPIVMKAIETAIKDDGRFEIEFPIVRLIDNAHSWVRAIGNLSHDKNRTAAFLTGIMHDVTDHKLDDLRKNDFIAIVSHELKSPLTSLQGYLQLLDRNARKTKDEFAIGALEKTMRQVKKMEVLISGFLNVSRLESGKIYLNRQSFEIDALTREIVAEITTANTTVTISVAADCGCIIQGDRDKIGQVITNILSNAIKYSPSDHMIEVSCKAEGESVQISIKDHGFGIKTEDLEKLFDRYYRVESAKTKTISGFGIGLYLCAEIIHRHNGKIWAESEIGKGSTFCFSIPCLH